MKESGIRPIKHIYRILFTLFALEVVYRLFNLIATRIIFRESVDSLVVYSKIMMIVGVAASSLLIILLIALLVLNIGNIRNLHEVIYSIAALITAAVTRIVLPIIHKMIISIIEDNGSSGYASATTDELIQLVYIIFYVISVLLFILYVYFTARGYRLFKRNNLDFYI